MEAEKAALIVDENTYAQQLDLLRFQMQRNRRGPLQPGEEARVEQDYQRASNAAKLLQLGQAALDLLGENENSLLTQAGVDRAHVAGTAAAGPRRRDRCSACTGRRSAALRELQAELSRYVGQVDMDPAACSNSRSG